MISVKPIIWKKEQIDLTNDYYYAGYVNDILMITIFQEGEKYKIYDNFQQNLQEDDVIFKKVFIDFDLCKKECEKNIQNYILSFIDIRSYKIDELLKK